MEGSYTFFQNIANEVESIPADSIVSRTVYRGEDGIKIILFGFAPGQELSEHNASVPAIIQILQGEADLTLGKDHFTAGPGTFARMDAQLAHSVYAKTPVVMLLIMLGKSE